MSNLDEALSGVYQNNLLYESLLELSNFEGAPSEFLHKLIQIKRSILKATNGALIKLKEEGACGLIASSPAVTEGQIPSWIQQVLQNSESLLGTQGVHCRYVENTLDGQKRYLVYQPLKAGSNELGIEIYNITVKNVDHLNASLERLQILMPYYDFYEGKLKLNEFRERTGRLHKSFELMIKINTHESFLGSLMAICNEFSAKWGCSRVSFGLLKSNNIKIKAMSNSEKFNRKMDLVRDLESVMEECADQDLEVNYPQQGAGIYVCRRAQHFSNTHGPLSLLSVPLRYEGKTLGVLCFERSIEKPFSNSEMETFRLSADLLSPRLANLKKLNRWFGRRLLDGIKNTCSFFLGTKHTWIKIIIFLVLGVGYWLSQAKTMYQVEASFRFDSQKSLSVSVPYSGEIDEVYVKNGQNVQKGDRLFTLDTVELQLKLRDLQSKKLQTLKKAAVALREGETAEEQMSRVEAEGIKAEIDLIEYSIGKSVIKAQMDGTVVGTELEKKKFSVVELGKDILEIIQIDSLESILYVPEDQIADVITGQSGELVAAGYPDRRIKFEIIEIEKIARVIEQQNVYRVKASIVLSSKDHFIRAGMEGVARVDVEERLLAWVFTRKAINWVRMTLWF